MTRGSRRGTAFATVALGTVLLLASAAFACGSWKGKLRVEGQASTVSESYGLGSGMFRCATGNLYGAQASSLTGTITVSTGIANCATGDKKLDPSPQPLTGQYVPNYTINLTWGFPEQAIGLDDCMNATNAGITNGAGWKVLDVVAINGSGEIVGQPKQYNVAGLKDDTGAPVLPGRSLICISHAQGHINNQTELQLL